MPRKILCVGDLHMKDMLSYGDYIKDQRTSERQEVLDFIVKSAEDCGSVVFMGDNFDHKNNSAEVVRGFIEFVERFKEKQLYIISGNHEKKGDGKTAIDFIREINNPNWHIMNKLTIGVSIEDIKVDFLPFLLKSEMGVETDIELTKEIMKHLKHGRILFHHHMVEGLSVNNLVVTDQFKEPILPKEELEKRYELVIGGHIHVAQNEGKIWVAGNVFNTVVGDIGKSILKINVSTMEVEKINLPGRMICQIFNPNISELMAIPKDSIVKAIITEKGTDIENLKKSLERFDAYILSEQYPNKREKIHFEEGALDMDLDKLLKIYSNEKKVDFTNLMGGWELIK